MNELEAKSSNPLLPYSKPIQNQLLFKEPAGQFQLKPPEVMNYQVPKIMRQAQGFPKTYHYCLNCSSKFWERKRKKKDKLIPKVKHNLSEKEKNYSQTKHPQLETTQQTEKLKLIPHSTIP